MKYKKKNKQGLTPEKILEMIEFFKKYHFDSDKDKTILISMKIKYSLLQAFKLKAKHHNMAYQTQIKELMIEWLRKAT